MSENILIDAIIKGFAIVSKGNCVYCGMPLDGDRLFLCEECERLHKENEKKIRQMDLKGADDGEN